MTTPILEYFWCGDDFDAEPGFAASLRELREFRGRIAWDAGRRPDFRRPDGSFTDDDPHDLVAHHLLLRPPGGGDLIGCCRYAPLETLPCSRIRELDATTADSLCAELACADTDILEGGRLLVAPEWRRHGLASDLLLAGTALARVLSRRVIWGTAGVRQGQEHVFLRLGYRCADAPLIPAPHYADDLRIIVCEPHRVPPESEPRTAEFTVRLTALLAKPVPRGP
ncbi:GNAT family N-acetyltransferase [Nocardia huaxiensis]|uniref:GNAT family N-acetyltransferase n=1 Tax=Nocardia huaxiensis TaxID=2755382 RepID=A0A7D6ZIG9_9NOCA|nr:GNAT family N-acetyltransferase [Nocardia huaxiensis]QLY30560.1 GNAT family N-acetyltransferase [Nocardia huaxiensis]UFS95836.1 GNAT family N-acetyltransferase [Nocardia huaxiensis]